MDQPAPRFPDCQICQNIWLQFASPDDAPEVLFGSLDDIDSFTCPTYTPLAQAFRTFCITELSGDQIRLATRDVGFHSRQGQGLEERSPELLLSISKHHLVWNLLLAHRSEIPDHPGTGRVLDPDWIDLEVVKGWKRECLASHGAICENPMKIPRTRPDWLIDVSRRCVTPGASCSPFVALSYRWGDTPNFRADRILIEEIQRERSLDDPEIAKLLPPVLHHAMALTAAIGERYLWADTLCIVHGDDAATAKQLSLMGAIYANVVVTIIAADGAAQDGIPGLQNISPPRGLAQTIIPFGEDERILLRNTRIFTLVHGGGQEYYKRGWTYQERKLSPRKLIINRKEIHWECQHAVWHEELLPGVEIDKYIDPCLRDVLSGFPDWRSLGRVISRYNRCQLTYDEDANQGLSGLLAIVSRAFPGGFLYGLPEMLFDRALGWTPYFGSTELRRRKASEDRALDGQLSASSALPSWSWVGWQGEVDMGSGEAALIDDSACRINETIPITTWYTSSSPMYQPRREIKSTWFVDRNGFKDSSRPLPKGWTARVPSDDEERLYPEGFGERVFKHENLSFVDGDEWYYPFPVPVIEPSMPLYTPVQTPFLFCNTQRAFLSARPALPRQGEYIQQIKNIVALMDANGKKVGTLYCQNAEQRALFDLAKKEEGEEGGEEESEEKSEEKSEGEPEHETTAMKQVEVVAISRSIHHKKTFDDEKQKYGLPHTRWESYAVLWVEWEDGVAYRLASGHVYGEAWESLEKSDVELVLG